MKGRTYGAVAGELFDYHKLQKEVEDLRAETERLKLSLQEEKENNLALANELRDRDQQIKTYESQFYKKEDD